MQSRLTRQILEHAGSVHVAILQLSQIHNQPAEELEQKICQLGTVQRAIRRKERLPETQISYDTLFSKTNKRTF